MVTLIAHWAGKHIPTFILAACILGIFTAFPGSVQGSTPTVRVGEAEEAEIGSFVQIPVNVTNSPEVAAFYFALKYDPDVAIVQPRTEQDNALKLGASLSGSNPLANLNHADEGEIQVAWFEQHSVELDETGEICVISFEIVGEGTTLLELSKVEIVNGGKIEVNKSNGFISTGPPPDVEDIRILGDDPLVLGEGGTVQLEVEIEPAHAPSDVAWSSSEPDIASVDEDSGLVTGISRGHAVITATGHDGSTDSIDVEVTGPIPVEGVTITGGDRTMEINETESLELEFDPEDATNKDVTWRSSDSGIVSVSTTGLVRARDEGTAEITVITDDGEHEDTIEITVEEPEILIETSRVLPYGYTDRSYEEELSARGGSKPYRWRIVSGSLPSGLRLDRSEGEIYGTPREPGRYDFTIRVTDDDGFRYEKEFILWIAERDDYHFDPRFRYPADWGHFQELTISYSSMTVSLQPQSFPYTMVVNRDAGSISIDVTLNRSGDRLTINGVRHTADRPRSVNLFSGTNNITVSIDPVTGASRRFNITVYKIP